MTTFGFIVGEVFRRVTGRTIGQYLRTEIAEPLGADVHIGLSAGRTTPLRRSGEQAARARPAGRRASPRLPDQPGRPPQGGAVDLDGFRPRRRARLARPASCGAELEFPGTNGQVSALGLATFYNALAQEKLLSREHMDLVRVSQGGFETDLVLGPRVADHGWGLGYMLNQRCVNGPNPRIFGHGGLGGSFGFVDLEHRIGYAYVANRFDATKANADPRSLALSNEVYAALGVELGSIRARPAGSRQGASWLRGRLKIRAASRAVAAPDANPRAASLLAGRAPEHVAALQHCRADRVPRTPGTARRRAGTHRCAGRPGR